jgi:hypothetical protein
MKKLRAFHWLLMAALAASLPISAHAAGGRGFAFHDGRFITAFLLAAVSFAVTVSSHMAVSSPVSDSSGLVSLIHIHMPILIPIIGIQDPIGAIKSPLAKRRVEAYRARGCLSVIEARDRIRDRSARTPKW